MARSAPPQSPPEPAPEKEPGEKYLTLMEHLAELRYRVIVCSLAVVAGLAFTAIFTADIIDYLEEPARDKSENFQPQFLEPFEADGSDLAFVLDVEPTGRCRRGLHCRHDCCGWRRCR